MYFHIIEIIKFQQMVLSFPFPHFSSFPCSTFVDFSRSDQLLGASLIYIYVTVVTYTFHLYKKNLRDSIINRIVSLVRAESMSPYQSLTSPIIFGMYRHAKVRASVLSNGAEDHLAPFCLRSSTTVPGARYSPALSIFHLSVAGRGSEDDADPTPRGVERWRLKNEDQGVVA